jgi:hypothetical protein
MGKIRNLAARAFRKAAFTIEPPERQVEVSDDYVKWLCFANAGMLDKGNLYLIEQAMKQLPSAAPILEIGSFCGLSTNVLTHYKRKYGAKNRLVTCDEWEFENDDKDNKYLGESPILLSDYKAFVRESFLRNTRMFSGEDLPYTMEMTSNEFFAAWREGKAAQDVFERPMTLGGPISFCYIDGDHTYEGAKKDFLNCDAFLEKGGFLLFDDSTVENFGVRKLIPEVVGTGRYELAAQNPNHLFQKLG